MTKVLKSNKMKIDKVPIGSVIGILAMLLLPGARAQTIAPTATLGSAPPVEIIPQENHVVQRPAPAAIPFRPTMSASAYAAAKQAAAANYSPKPGSVRPGSGRSAHEHHQKIQRR